MEASGCLWCFQCVDGIDPLANHDITKMENKYEKHRWSKPKPITGMSWLFTYALPLCPIANTSVNSFPRSIRIKTFVDIRSWPRLNHWWKCLINPTTSAPFPGHLQWLLNEFQILQLDFRNVQLRFLQSKSFSVIVTLCSKLLK